MDFDYSDTQQMLLDSAGRVMAARGSIEQWRGRRMLPQGLDQEAWAQFAELGWLALSFAEDAGGLGGSFEDVALLMTAFGRGLDVSPYVSTAIVGAYLIDRGRSGKRRSALLGEVASGALRLAFADAEAGDRYEIQSPRSTIARSTPSGYVLDGTKTLVLDASSAGQLLVTATLDGAAGAAIFLVDTAADGISIDDYPMIDGSRAADLRFRDVTLPGAALIAEGSEASALIAAASDRANVALIAQALGSMEACLEICGTYLKERKQFGQPIGNFQALKHLAADMFVATHQTRSMLYQALSRIDAAPAQRARAVSAAKIVAGEAMQLVSRTAIQLHGGYGVTDEYAISHHYRRLMVIEKLYGDIDHHVRRLAALSLD